MRSWMPSPQPESTALAAMGPRRFGSPEWFESVPVPKRHPNEPVFVVEHRATSQDGEEFIHQQVFDEGGLADWVSGRVFSATDLVLERPSHIDAGDLMGLLPGSQIAEATAMTIDERTTDLFGVGPISRPGLEEHATGVFDMAIEAFDTPFGDIEAAIRLNADGTQQVILASEADSQIAISADWGDLVDWAHAALLLGHLAIDNRAQIDGDLVLCSYAGGHIAWPKAPRDQQWSMRFRQTLKTYRRHRHNPDFQEIMDRIEEMHSRIPTD